jgi:hypothetical protein
MPKQNYDVVVVGSGPGGLTAAVAAAKRGLKTALIEQNGIVGGNLQIGLNIHGFEDMNGKRVVGGSSWELIQRCIDRGGSVGTVRLEGAHMYSTTPVDMGILQACALEMIEESGVDLWLHTMATGVKRDRNRMTEVTTWSKSGEILFAAPVFIDATGDADLAYRAGAETVQGREADGSMQPMSLVITMAPVDIQLLVEELNEGGFGKAVKPGCEEEDYIWFALDFKGWREEVADLGIRLGKAGVFWGNSIHPQIVNLNVVKVVGRNGADTRELSDSESSARIAAVKFSSFLQSKVPGFSKAYLVRMAPYMGVRETKRIVGRYVLTKEDVLSGAIPKDTIALGGYPIDVHDPVDGIAEFARLETGRYGIPYRSLLTKAIDNLLVSGRAISASHEAVGATRVMGTCLAIGEACGYAAAQACEQETTAAEIDGAALHSELMREEVITGL